MLGLVMYVKRSVLMAPDDEAKSAAGEKKAVDDSMAPTQYGAEAGA